MNSAGPQGRLSSYPPSAEPLMLAMLSDRRQSTPAPNTMKRYLIGTLVGGASLFLVGYLIYVVLMPNPAFANGPAAALADRAAPNLKPIILAELLFGYLLTLSLAKSGAIGKVGCAAKTGALLGGLIALGYSLLILGTTEVTTTQGVLYEAVTWVVRWGIAGAVISMFVGKEKTE